jgi:hypothetical protein
MVLFLSLSPGSLLFSQKEAFLSKLFKTKVRKGTKLGNQVGLGGFRVLVCADTGSEDPQSERARMSPKTCARGWKGYKVRQPGEVGVGGFRVLACADTGSEDPPFRAPVYINFIETTCLYFKLEHSHYIELIVLGQPVCQAVHLLSVDDFVEG